MNIAKYYEIVKSALLHVFYPNFCCGCDCVLPYNKCICENCLEVLEKDRIKKPRRRTMYGKRFRIHSIYSYEHNNETARVVKHLKFNNYFNGSHFMGKAIADKARSLKRQYDYVTYVPLYDLSERNKKYNHCEYISGCVAKELRIKEKNCLKKVSITAKQHTLSSVERRINLKDSFVARSGVEGKNILLVDDVTTTGTTLCECANELYKKGANSVTLIAFALTQRKR